MLCYPIPEACELLESKLDGAKQKIADCEEDLDFLREQITVSFPIYVGSNLVSLILSKTIEVATARVYNWDITERRKEKPEKDENDEGEKTSKG